ncbi:uncharacterized protein VTP21DRAFT_3771 [Calcarisporiella thermophila]|uniref:uncharacterized protein n=1 Tax=Calcarisporiella thermophila TaxID=911321 RepID=UPI003742F71A
MKGTRTLKQAHAIPSRQWWYICRRCLTTNSIPPHPISENIPSNSGDEKLGVDPFAHSDPFKSGKEGEKRKESVGEFGSMTNSTSIARARDIKYKSIDPPFFVPIPRLAHGLDRVLFNPGVNYLQDPRTKIYNFDPYLRYILPPSEFDYDALAPYITSSKDKILENLAREHQKRYIGSTSSMTHVLSHFYYLISSWRPIDTSCLSMAFADQPNGFTGAMKAPATIYLRNRQGVYAIDADKSVDIPDGILSVLGKSMEKMLTLSPEEFDKYRKGNTWRLREDEKSKPEAYHYATVENFLLRSQLDCMDDRLPNKVFDLKTRAAISIRLDQLNYMNNIGYQINRSHGLFESFEREYYDMMRSAMLKYSLQVRIGSMDGIFVAYHNTAKIFGFQYISLDEMDARLFGNSVLGEESFLISLKLLRHVLDTVTERFPGKTLRLGFETSKRSQNLNIFAEVVPDEEGTNTQQLTTDFFSTSPLVLDEHAPLAKFQLRCHSKVNGRHITTALGDLNPLGSDLWEVHYELQEIKAPLDNLRRGYAAMRTRQMNMYMLQGAGEGREFPLLKTVRRLSREGALGAAEEDEEFGEGEVEVYGQNISAGLDLSRPRVMVQRPSPSDTDTVVDVADNEGKYSSKKRERVSELMGSLRLPIWPCPTAYELRTMNRKTLIRNLKKISQPATGTTEELRTRLDRFTCFPRAEHILQRWEQFLLPILPKRSDGTGGAKIPDLDALTKVELREVCKHLGVLYTSRENKAILAERVVETVRNAREVVEEAEGLKG